MDEKERKIRERYKNAASNLLVLDDLLEDQEKSGPRHVAHVRPAWDMDKWGGMTEEEAFAEDPASVVIEMGEEIASQTWSGGSWSSVYEYKQQYYSSDEVEFIEFGDVAAAFDRAGIGRNEYDEIDSEYVSPKYEYLLEKPEK